MTLKQVIEALVFASPKPLLTQEIVAALRSAARETEDQTLVEYSKATEEEVIALLEEIKVDVEQTGRAIRLVEQANGWNLVTAPAAAPWVRELYPEAKPTRLSGPALETLAIIAYRQPVTRADCEAVRGVAVDGVMQVLLDRGLVKICGRAEVPGRPLLYSTTEYFLQHFGLKTTDELPNVGELRRISLPTPPVPTEEESAAGRGRKKGKAAGATEKTDEAPGAADAAADASSPESAASPEDPPPGSVPEGAEEAGVPEPALDSPSESASSPEQPISESTPADEPITS